MTLIIKRLSADESARMIAESREKALRDSVSRQAEAHRKGLREGERKGELKGKLEGRVEVARNLLKRNCPLNLSPGVPGCPSKKSANWPPVSRADILRGAGREK
jgi:hypothetical protein